MFRLFFNTCLSAVSSQHRQAAGSVLDSLRPWRGHGAVSRQVRQLEEQLGIELFDRSGNRLSLTQEGRRLARSVGEALDQLTEGTLSVDPGSLSGELVVAAPPSISACWLLAMIGDFNRSYPEIEIRLDNIQPMQREVPADIEVAVCFGEPIAPNRVVREFVDGDIDAAAAVEASIALRIISTAGFFVIAPVLVFLRSQVDEGTS